MVDGRCDEQHISRDEGGVRFVFRETLSSYQNPLPSTSQLRERDRSSEKRLPPPPFPESGFYKILQVARCHFSGTSNYIWHAFASKFSCSSWLSRYERYWKNSSQLVGRSISAAVHKAKWKQIRVGTRFQIKTKTNFCIFPPPSFSLQIRYIKTSAPLRDIEILFIRRNNARRYTVIQTLHNKFRTRSLLNLA